MLAGLPKAPSAYNPVTNPKRAKTRQLYVLRRMHDLNYHRPTIPGSTKRATGGAAGLRDSLPTHAESVAEMARQVVFDAYGDDAYTRGITVWTTVRKPDQEAAYAAVRRGVLDYDRRHGYRGPGSVRQPARRPGRAGAGARPRCSRKRPTATTWCRHRHSRLPPREVKAVLAAGDVRRSPATGSSSSRAT